MVVEQLGFAHLLSNFPRIMMGRWQCHLTRGMDGYAPLVESEVWHLSYPKFEERRELLVRVQRGLVLEQRLPAISSRRRRYLSCKLLHEV